MKYHLNTGVGVLGSTSIEKSIDQDSDSVKITKRGTARHSLIPLIIVVCEDIVAKTVLGLVARELGHSYNIVMVGAWKNMATLLYGMHFYRTQLALAGDARFLEVVCVTDGDISRENIEKAVSETHRGNHVSPDAQKILSHIEQSLVHFGISESPDVFAIPEYCHKNWLEEITEDSLSQHFSEELTKLESLLSDDPVIVSAIYSKVADIKCKIREILRVIDCSKSINFIKPDKKPDLHRYYSKLKNKLKADDTLRYYPQHMIEFTVLSIIKEYNKKRWEDYVAPVKDALCRASTRQFATFNRDRFNFTEL